jgi:hypothetical protein
MFRGIYRHNLQGQTISQVRNQQKQQAELTSCFFIVAACFGLLTIIRLFYIYCQGNCYYLNINRYLQVLNLLVCYKLLEQVCE